MQKNRILINDVKYVSTRNNCKFCLYNKGTVFKESTFLNL